MRPASPMPRLPSDGACEENERNDRATNQAWRRSADPKASSPIQQPVRAGWHIAVEALGSSPVSRLHRAQLKRNPVFAWKINVQHFRLVRFFDLFPAGHHQTEMHHTEYCKAPRPNQRHRSACRQVLNRHWLARGSCIRASPGRYQSGSQTDAMKQPFPIQQGALHVKHQNPECDAPTPNQSQPSHRTHRAKCWPALDRDE